MLSPKERLLKVLNKEKVDRPPVICTGGMMNAAIVEIMNRTGHTLPAAHTNPQLMADLAHDVHEYTGFENFGVPFCVTVEAEILGSAVTYGTLACEPKVVKEQYASTKNVVFHPIEHLLDRGRVAVVAEAISLLSAKYPDVPVIGNLTGPISAAASLVDPVILMKEFWKEPESCHRVLQYVTDLLIQFATVMIGKGATVISVGDPTASGEILGPRIFKKFAVRYLNQLIDAIQARHVPVILHICGNMNTVRNIIPEIGTNAWSLDALVNLQQLKEDYPSITTMGNISTYLLQLGSAENVAAQSRRLVKDGVDIISPACGLSTSTSLAVIQALTRSVKEGNQ